MTLTFDLETGAQCSTCRGVRYPPANVGDTKSIRFKFMGYWAWARVDPIGAVRDVTASDRSARSNFYCLDGRN